MSPFGVAAFAGASFVELRSNEEPETRRIASAMTKKVALLANGTCRRESWQQLWSTIRGGGTNAEEQRFRLYFEPLLEIGPLVERSALLTLPTELP